MFDAVVGVTKRETTISVIALAIHSVVAIGLFFWAIRPARERRFDYWLVTGLGITVRGCFNCVCALSLTKLNTPSCAPVFLLGDSFALQR